MAVPVAPTSTIWYAAGGTPKALQNSVARAAITVTTTAASQGSPPDQMPRKTAVACAAAR